MNSRNPAVDAPQDETPDAEAQSDAQAFVTAVTAQVGLGLPHERLELLARAAAPVHKALQGLAAIDLGETVPAMSFDPSWDA
jgi:hypothetical protein